MILSISGIEYVFKTGQYTLRQSADGLQDEMKERSITESNGLFIVKQNNIDKEGFRIELNTVVIKKNVNEILNIFEFASKYGISLKVLTVNDFGGRVDSDDVSVELRQLLLAIYQKGYKESNVFLNNYMGIQMKRFLDENGCTLTIVDHQNSLDSITPRRTFSDKCKVCKYYPTSRDIIEQKYLPCATGVMNITLRADGLLQYCRLRPEEGIFIDGANDAKMHKSVLKTLEFFDKCFFMNVDDNIQDI